MNKTKKTSVAASAAVYLKNELHCMWNTLYIKALVSNSGVYIAVCTTKMIPGVSKPQLFDISTPLHTNY